jgi:hypothetical protein
MDMASLRSVRLEPFVKRSDNDWFRFQFRQPLRVPTKRWVAWLMMNPSVAGTKKATDRTIDIVAGFTEAWGFDGFVVVNLFPFVSPRSDEEGEFHLWRKAQIDRHGVGWFKVTEEMQRNLAEIEEAGRMATRRVAAFGGPIETEDRDWVKECVKRFEHPSDCSIRESLRCLRINSGTFLPGHPKPRKNTPIPESAYKEPEPWSRRPWWLA